MKEAVRLWMVMERAVLLQVTLTQHTCNIEKGDLLEVMYVHDEYNGSL